MNDNTNYTKTIDLSFDFDEASYNKIQDALDNLKTDVVDDDMIKALLDMLKESKGIKKQKGAVIEEEGEETKRSLKEWGKEFVDRQLTDFVTSFMRTLHITFANIGSELGEKLANIFKDAWSNLSDILSYSRLSNADIRKTAFEFGFNPAQNYAYTQTMQLMGMSDIEDLAYMTKGQRSKFQEKFEEYSARYTKLYDSGFFDKLEEFNWEMEEFKQDMEYEVMQWFVDNKDTIRAILDGIMTITKAVLQIFGWLLGGSQGRRTSEEILAETERRLNISTTNNNNNVSINNTFNGVGQSDKTWLANAGAMTYEQVIRSMGGR